MLVRTVAGRIINTPLLTTRTSSIFVIMPMLISRVFHVVSFFSHLSFCKKLVLISFLREQNSEKVTGRAFVEVIKDEVEENGTVIIIVFIPLSKCPHALVR